MNSRENMGALGSRIANMGQTLMQAAIRTGVAAGVSAAAAHIEEEHQKEAKERTDRRLHNTRLLLKNYRLLKRHTAGAIYNAKQAKEKESAASILDGLESYTRDDSLYIESMRRLRRLLRPGAGQSLKGCGCGLRLVRSWQSRKRCFYRSKRRPSQHKPALPFWHPADRRKPKFRHGNRRRRQRFYPHRNERRPRENPV